MRTLYVSFFYPWPGHSGWGRRLANTVEALRSLGPVDFICLDNSDRPRDPAPAGVRMLWAPEGDPPPRRSWVVRWLTGHLPREILARDFDSAAARIPALLDGPYDAVVVPYIHAWPAIAAHLPTAPIVLDLGDLVDDALRSRRRAGFSAQSASVAGRLSEWVRWQASVLADRVDERRYRRLQHEAGGRCDRVFVCSDLDAARLGLDNVVTIPNGYQRTHPPRADTVVRDRDAPVFVFVGLYSYAPNADAARWFAREVFPAVRRALPGARFRVVGPQIDKVGDLAGLAGVELVGWVDEVAPEVTGADVVVVPVRFGSGTRLKVIEAMANGTPMVSTALGCEGTGVVDGKHLLVADGATEFAAACVRLVSDEELRADLSRAAAQLFEQRYQWSTIRDEIATQVRRASGVANHRG